MGGGSRFRGWGWQCGEGRRQGRWQPGLGTREDWIQEAAEGVSFLFCLVTLSSYPAIWGHSLYWIFFICNPPSQTPSPSLSCPGKLTPEVCITQALCPLGTFPAVQWLCYDSALLLQGAWVQFLDWELRSHKTLKKKKSSSGFLFILPNGEGWQESGR